MDTGTKSKLKPCPFCGGEAVISFAMPYGEGAYVCNCQNEKCGATVGVSCFDTKKEAAEAWNRRVGE